MNADLESRIKSIGSQVTAQMLEWGRVRRTGRIEIVITDGAPVHVHRNDTVRIPKQSAFKDGKSPCCQAEILDMGDFGQRGTCAKCGAVRASWD